MQVFAGDQGGQAPASPLLPLSFLQGFCLTGLDLGSPLSGPFSTMLVLEGHFGSQVPPLTSEPDHPGLNLTPALPAAVWP